MRLPLASKAMPVTVEGCAEAANFRAFGVEEGQVFTGAAGEQAVFRMREGGGMIHPFHAEIGDFGDRSGVTRLNLPSSPPETKPSAREILRQRQHRAVMRPGHGASLSAIGEMHRAVAQREGRVIHRRGRKYRR